MSLIEKEFRAAKLNKFTLSIENFLNSLFLRKTKFILTKPFSAIKLKSEISHVVYLNWMVPLAKIQQFVPSGIALDLVGDHVLFSVLTYRHGHFGPAKLYHLKSLYGSPLQSNWRLYISQTQKQFKVPTVLFLANVMSSQIYCIGSRLFSSMMYTHQPLAFQHNHIGVQTHTKIIPGRSNAPDLEVVCHPCDHWNIPSQFLHLSKDINQLLNKIIIQDQALTPLDNGLFRQANIALKFDPKDIRPLKIDFFKSETLADIVQHEKCFAFEIPAVSFFMNHEKTIKL
ncbi:DUF2071 domain-containing protein [Sphingobacterium sp. UBA7625]|uniref:DUF2071 domain-containing protein n=1 Tax=Sphingobacterium sp. UBA7625 TaxID=1947522 RepID=UPI00257D3A2C|nr:DUF2071 domain-containing protein [Sphingobacterium sp. UBA7625]